MGLKDIVRRAFCRHPARDVGHRHLLRGGQGHGRVPQGEAAALPALQGSARAPRDPGTGDTKCVACMLCATICPSRCISIVGEQTSDGRSHPASFDLDLSRCIFCGLCEEVCPAAAIVMTRHYELATFDKNDFALDKDRLLANQVYAHKELYAGRRPRRRAAQPRRTLRRAPVHCALRR